MRWLSWALMLEVSVQGDMARAKGSVETGKTPSACDERLGLRA